MNIQEPYNGKRKKSNEPRSFKTTPAHASSPSDNQPVVPPPSRVGCPKCQGLVARIPSDEYQRFELRCVNCGWQPQFGTRIIKETQESRVIRQQIAQSFCKPFM